MQLEAHEIPTIVFVGASCTQGREVPTTITMVSGRAQYREMPTIVTVVSGGDLHKEDIASNVVYNTTDSATTSVFMDYSSYTADLIEEDCTHVEVTTVASSVAYSSIVDTLEVTDLTYEQLDMSCDTVLMATNHFVYNIETEWYLNPQAYHKINDTPMDFRMALGLVPISDDVDVDIHFCAVRYYSCTADIYCCFMDTYKTIEVDVERGDGRIVGVYNDIYTAISGTSYVNTSIYNTRVGTSGILEADFTSISGAITYMPSDVYSAALGVSGTTFVDFKTRSLFTGDFFVDIDEFVTASSIAWVDIIDYLYPIDTDNTFFYVEGVEASGVYFEDIPNGKRMYYDPLDDFYSDGVLNYSLHAESIIGEVEEKEFYFLYGYDLQLNEVVDWGPNKQVLVRAEAGNLAFCPGLAGAAFDFKTVDFTSFNLGCTITPVGHVDLPVIISPQSTAFFYDKTFTVRLRNVKDFAGNIMPDLEYTFTIEDPTA
jgi:hypothetical protein